MIQSTIIKTLLAITDEMTSEESEIILKEYLEDIIEFLVISKFEFKDNKNVKNKDKYTIISDIMDLLKLLYEEVDIKNTNILDVLKEINKHYNLGIDFKQIKDTYYKVLVFKDDSIYLIPKRYDYDLIEILEIIGYDEDEYKIIVDDLIGLIKNTTTNFKSNTSIMYVKYENGKDKILRKHIINKEHEKRMNDMLNRKE